MENGEGPKCLLKFSITLLEGAMWFDKDYPKILRLFDSFMSKQPKKIHKLIIEFENPNILLVSHTENESIDRFEADVIKNIVIKTIFNNFLKKCSECFTKDTLDNMILKDLV